MQRLLAEPRQLPEPPSAQAERELYAVLLGAMEAGLVRTMDDALKVLEHASKPLGVRGEEWLKRQERALGDEPERPWNLSGRCSRRCCGVGNHLIIRQAMSRTPRQIGLKLKKLRKAKKRKLVQAGAGSGRVPRVRPQAGRRRK